MRGKCKNCINLKNDWCEKAFDSPDPEIERDCYYFKHMTNADKIRAMTAEELFHLFTDAYGVFACPSDGKCVDEDCSECWERWLKQEVEE